MQLPGYIGPTRKQYANKVYGKCRKNTWHMHEIKTEVNNNLCVAP